MKILVFGGSGKIGTAVAWDLAQVEDVKTIGLVGRTKATLDKVKKLIGSDKIKIHVADVDDKAGMTAIMQKYDVGAMALPDRHTSYKICHYAVECGLNIVDMLEEYHKRPDAEETEGLDLPKGMTLNQYGDWIHSTAVKNKVTFVDGMGFAPGLSNVTVGEAIRKMDVAEKAIARVGGIPSKKASANHPLKYMITWAFEHVLREYNINLLVIKGGKIVEVPAIQERESFKFKAFGKDEPLQCAVTPGMPSFMFTRPQLKEFTERTVRWPGHYDMIDQLKMMGLLSIEPEDFKGMKVVPREFLLHLLKPRLAPKPGEGDVCVMYNTVEGKKNGKKIKIEYHMWDEYDPKTGFTGMQRVTGFPVAIAAVYVGRGWIKERGIVAPEDAIGSDLYPTFIQDLRKRNIKIKETVTKK